MRKIIILLFSFLAGIVLTISSIWWWGGWDVSKHEPWPAVPPGMIIFPPATGCIQHGGPLPFFGTCINNKILNFGIDIIIWSVVIFGFLMVIESLRKQKSY